MRDLSSKLLSNEEVAEDFFLARLHNPEIAESAVPGQFLQIRVTERFSPFLRIPLSISGVDPPQGVIEVLYEAMGPKSRALASVAPGVHLDCLGPLGCGFDPPEGSRILLVGGGIGVPPLLFLGGQRRLRGSEVLLLVGARKAAKLLPDELLNRAADQVRVATDDGSRGHSGLVTDLLEQELEVSPYSVVCTCGPHPMMAKVSAICEESQVACQASLEEYMACGFGVCVGCVVEVKAGSGAALSDYGKYSRVCIDGPVFDARRVCWERPW